MSKSISVAEAEKIIGTFYNILREGMPGDKVIPLRDTITAMPITTSHFLRTVRTGTNGLYIPTKTAKKETVEASVWIILAVGPDVKSPEIQPGRVCNFSRTKLDTVHPQGEVFEFCEEDIGVIYRAEDLQSEDFKRAEAYRVSRAELDPGHSGR